MFRAQLSQVFPPEPVFTEADVPPQKGKVFVVTGGASGIGLELTRILKDSSLKLRFNQKGARVYIAGRSEEKAQQAIHNIRAAAPSSSDATGSFGSLEFLQLDLEDLSTIKASAADFKARESKLDVLWNNAGVSQPPLGSVSKQGIELQLATNCLAAATCTDTPGSVRVVWTGSQMMELSAPPEAIIMSELAAPPKDTTRNYVNSKTGNFLLATELARQQQQQQRQQGAATISVSTNPGAASTNMLRHTPWTKYLARPLLYPARLAALTQLYAGVSADVTVAKNGCYVIPWGRISTQLKKDLTDAAKLKEDGGTGRAREFWEFCEDGTASYR
ncbi:putative oxidoreductase-like protein [Chaetomidium leptoderma]|uniref:Oxidoreductase-like protein n=1 Tax=Chaetomidium leptoderma TaxID=669021 RepID=A0AAN6ZZZ2_9PEZI|nr:putative oxidoreductase-like protein [Chaetomidium leptoderma]